MQMVLIFTHNIRKGEIEMNKKAYMFNVKAFFNIILNLLLAEEVKNSVICLCRNYSLRLP